LKLSPTALLILQGDDVQVYSLTQKSNLEKLAEMIPDIINKFQPQAKAVE